VADDALQAACDYAHQVLTLAQPLRIASDAAQHISGVDPEIFRAFRAKLAGKARGQLAHAYSSAGRPALFELTAPTLNVNLTQQTLHLPTFDASYAGAHLSGGAQAVKILDDLSMTGAVNAAPVVLREFATRLADIGQRKSRR